MEVNNGLLLIGKEPCQEVILDPNLIAYKDTTTFKLAEYRTKKDIRKAGAAFGNILEF